MDWTDFGAVLSWVVSGGGAGLLAYQIVDGIRWFKELPGEPKRYVSWAIAGTISVGAWATLTWFGAGEWPVTPQAWIAAVFQVVALGILGSEVTHARRDLSKRSYPGRATPHRG